MMSDEKAKAEQKLIDEAVHIARETGATPEMINAAIAADRRMQSDEKAGRWWWDSDRCVLSAINQHYGEGYPPQGHLLVLAICEEHGVSPEPDAAALIADAWQLPQLREENRQLRERLRREVERDKHRRG